MTLTVLSTWEIEVHLSSPEPPVSTIVRMLSLRVSPPPLLPYEVQFHLFTLKSTCPSVTSSWLDTITQHCASGYNGK